MKLLDERMYKQSKGGRHIFSNEPKARIGIVGLQSWVHAIPLARYCMSSENYELVGIVDETTQLEGFGREFKFDRLYSNIDSFLENKDIDALIVTKQVIDNENVIKKAAEHRINVLCDKPMAVDGKGAERILRIAQESRIKLGMLHNHRFSPTLIELKKRIDSDIIGKPKSISYSIRAPLPEEFYGCGLPGWYADKQRFGGGGFIDHGAHIIDTICWFLVKDIISVSAQMANLIHKDLAVEDYGVALITYKSGIIATVESAWTLPASLGWSEVIQIIGDRGEIVASRVQHPNVCIRANMTNFNSPISYDVSDPAEPEEWTENLKKVLDNFIGYIRGREDLQSPPEDAVTTMQVIDAAYKSADFARAIML